MIALLALALIQGAAQSDFPGWTVACDHHQYELSIDGDVMDARGGTVSMDPADQTRKPRCEILAARAAADLRGRRVRVSARIGGSDLTDSTYLVLKIDHVAPRDFVVRADGNPAKVNLRSLLSTGGTPLIVAELDVPAGADSIVLGVGLAGRGSLNVHNLRLEVLTSATPADAALPTISLGASELATLIRADSGRAVAQAPTRTFAKIDSVARTFFVEWFAAWSDPASVQLRRSWVGPPAARGAIDSTDASRLQRIDDPLGDPARLLAHCHQLSQAEKTGGALRLSGVDSQLISTVLIPTASKHAVCPSWLLAPETLQAGDEATNPDTAIATRFRDYIRRERAQLIGSLDLAAAVYPADNRVAQLRLRLLTDQRDTAAAVRAVSGCAVDKWLCGMLAGYVSFWQGRIAAADSLFTSAVRLAPVDVRCTLTDLHALIPAPGRANYVALPCNLRDSVNANLWWLSDPLFTEAGNERRAAHYARRISVMMHAVVPADDPYDWANGHGGVAPTDMVVRYGWPTSMTWVGPADDQNHFEFLDDAEPVHFTTNEYAPDRYHTVPTWAAITNPAQATADQWELTARAALRAKPNATLWWPTEHFAHVGGPLVQLADYQLSVFRRDSVAMIGLAAPLDAADLQVARGTAASGSLVFSVTPDSFHMVAVTGSVGGSLAAHGTTAARPQVIGLEARVPTTSPDRPITARTRFGVTPPPPLVQLAAGTIAISDLALLVVPPDTVIDGSDPDRLLPFMVGTTRLRNAGKTSIYWETYGFAADDSVTTSLQVERLDPPSRLRSLAQTVGLAGRIDDKMSVAWTDRAANQAFPIPASAPAFGHHVSVDLSTLQFGHYRITITVTRHDGTKVAAAREVNIVE
jgi:hypothetical protein